MPQPTAYNGAMELESLEYKIVMEDGRDTEVLGRLTNLHMATAAYMAAIARHPKRNITLRQGTRIIKRNDGEPRPEPPRDPNSRSWSVHFIGGVRRYVTSELRFRNQRPQRASRVAPGRSRRLVSWSPAHGCQNPCASGD
jgi:hypothetical protein